MNASSFWGTLLGQLSIELIGGIAGAFLFLFIILFLFRPKLKIGEFICVSTTNMQDNYSFKIVNKSFFAAHELYIELFAIQNIPMGGGKYNRMYDKLDLVLNRISHISRRRSFWQKTSDNKHCMVIRCNENLRKILSVDTNAVVIKISLRHGLTGLAEVYEQEYGNESDLRNGKFKPGTKIALI